VLALPILLDVNTTWLNRTDTGQCDVLSEQARTNFFSMNELQRLPVVNRGHGGPPSAVGAGLPALMSGLPALKSGLKALCSHGAGLQAKEGIVKRGQARAYPPPVTLR